MRRRRWPRPRPERRMSIRRRFSPAPKTSFAQVGKIVDQGILRVRHASARLAAPRSRLEAAQAKDWRIVQQRDAERFDVGQHQALGARRQRAKSRRAALRARDRKTPFLRPWQHGRHHIYGWPIT